LLARCQHGRRAQQQHAVAAARDEDNGVVRRAVHVRAPRPRVQEARKTGSTSLANTNRVGVRTPSPRPDTRPDAIVTSDRRRSRPGARRPACAARVCAAAAHTPSRPSSQRTTSELCWRTREASESCARTARIPERHACASITPHTRSRRWPCRRSNRPRYPAASPAHDADELVSAQEHEDRYGRENQRRDGDEPQPSRRWLSGPSGVLAQLGSACGKGAWADEWVDGRARRLLRRAFRRWRASRRESGRVSSSAARRPQVRRAKALRADAADERATGVGTKRRTSGRTNGRAGGRASG
ncbi:uncharacterized protein B0H18DRAFT_1213395, partial [Fomitopsis serialis]|uniref:uncharacterized protein n=1 Tax=Fomitopsis serialis TaxID=139415 RepID=UPI002007DC26